MPGQVSFAKQGGDFEEIRFEEVLPHQCPLLFFVDDHLDVKFIFVIPEGEEHSFMFLQGEAPLGAQKPIF